MTLSKDTISVLVDMIENKLAMIQISDREELREVMTLQHCLAELQGMTARQSNDVTTAIPTRGRRRKLSRIMDDFDVHHEPRKTA